MMRHRIALTTLAAAAVAVVAPAHAAAELDGPCQGTIAGRNVAVSLRRTSRSDMTPPISFLSVEHDRCIAEETAK